MSQSLIYIIEPDAVYSETLQKLLETSYLQSKVFGSAEDFLAVYDLQQPGCLISEIRLPGINGWELLQYLTQGEYALPIIFLTRFGDVPAAVEFMKHGAFYFLEKEAADHILLRIVQDALQADEKNRAAYWRWKKIFLRYSQLTLREKQVLRQMLQGDSNKMIAMKLNVTIKTIEYHRKRIMRTMQAESLAQLIQSLCLLKEMIQEEILFSPLCKKPAQREDLVR